MKDLIKIEEKEGVNDNMRIIIDNKMMSIFSAKEYSQLQKNELISNSIEFAKNTKSFIEKLYEIEELICDSYKKEKNIKEIINNIKKIKKDINDFPYIFDCIFESLFNNRTTKNKYRKDGYVYILKFKDKIKIGRSIDPYKRIRTIETQGGEKIDEYYIYGPLKYDYRVESEMHSYYKKNRLVGEYFNIGFNDAILKLKEFKKDYK